jgi:hypothetical protein
MDALNIRRHVLGDSTSTAYAATTGGKASAVGHRGRVRHVKVRTHHRHH